MKKILFLLVLIGAMSTACLKGHKSIVYTPDTYREAVLDRLGKDRQIDIRIPGSSEGSVAMRVTSESILRPPYELRGDVLKKIRECVGRAGDDLERLSNLYDCLNDGGLEQFKYVADSTLDAMKCYETRSGNCFSMTNLFIGAGRNVNLNIYYMLVEDIISNQSVGDTIIHTNHIIGAIQIGQRRKIVDFIPNAKNYHYMTMLSDIQAAGLFYNNLATRLLVKRRDGEAWQLFRIALDLYPESYQIHNNVGVLFLRRGDLAIARQHFVKALKEARFPDLILGNVMTTFERSGKMDEFRKIRKDLEGAKKRNPYFYISEAARAYQKKDYNEALRLCKVARKINREIIDIYSLEFRVYGALGDKKKQQSAYEKILKYTGPTPSLPE